MELCQKLPKVELHAHLNGSLSVETINKLHKLHKSSFPSEDVPNVGDITIDPKSFDDGYAIFKFAQALVDHPDAVKLATTNVLKEFADDNVVYLELRSTPRAIDGKMTKKEYVEAIVDSIKGQDQVKATLLVSIDRRKSTEEAEENVKLAIELRNIYPDVIVGVDLSGDARVNDLKDYYPYLQMAKENDLKVSLHFAEENNHSEIEFVLNFATFKPDRVGHCTFVSPDFVKLFADQNIPSEICLTSNVKCGSVKSYENHHLKEFHEKKLPFCICTDDKGVFSCSSSDEHYRAMQLIGLKPEEMFSLSMKCVDFIFADEKIKSTLKVQIQAAMTQ